MSSSSVETKLAMWIWGKSQWHQLRVPVYKLHSFLHVPVNEDQTCVTSPLVWVITSIKQVNLNCVGPVETFIKDFGRLRTSTPNISTLSPGMYHWISTTRVQEVKHTLDWNVMGLQVCIFMLLSSVEQMAVFLSQTSYNDTILTTTTTKKEKLGLQHF